ncbi:zinc finger CCCH domain-containing protein 64 isoform X2 [Physcomitrium patens]|uniref:zinc finger CCCH domain-containing protein 64 isoform X2 n=1 Tax=Physcomitrium patens TaxID=3218 RepID=UPI000D176BCA|nr:zinc finger CCCH domain-containing protein 64-like isoform X2 [Physcomitrium patens]|eukprot:XP_024399683.1 zinc finger CCCH domain-containing protein 64-like isoform X2 [Physcomitrella patens]
MNGGKQAPRILVFGDVLGRLDALFKRVQSVNKSNGPFDAALCVGQFFPEDERWVEGMEGYFTGEKPVPLPTYFIGDYGEGANSLLAPARKTALDLGFSMGGIPVCDNLFYLKGSGILNLKGLRIAYLSGRYIPDVYQNARGAEASGGHFEDDVDALRAIADDKEITDIFLSNEWPLGVHNAADSSSDPNGIDLASTGSDIAAELASLLKPRYHFAGSEGVFYAREPYINPDSTHVTRFIGVGAVGNDKKQKFAHALAPTPASEMSPLDLAARPTNTTPSPYIKGAHNKSTTGTTQKRDVSQMDKANEENVQHWRYDTSQGKRQKRNDGGDRVCFEFVKQGSCSRGETCKFKHDLGNGVPIPKGACFDFVTKGRCEKGADCRFKHSLEDWGPAEKALPPGSCFDFFRKGQCERGSECRFSHSLDDPRPPRAPPSACWFCLSSPNIETHLVVSVGDHCYCAIAKGPLCPGHVLILPIEHQPSIVSLPSDAELELDKYKHSIRECFKKQGKATIFFERYLQLRAGTHAHLQAVPIPLSMASLALSSFVSSAKEVGFSFEVIHQDNDNEAKQRLKELVGGGVNYFIVELHEGTLLVHPLPQGEKLPMQFGREVLAKILGTPERGDWKQCKLDVSEETALADQFKEQFQEFDPMP